MPSFFLLNIVGLCWYTLPTCSAFQCQVSFSGRCTHTLLCILLVWLFRHWKVCLCAVCITGWPFPSSPRCRMCHAFLRSAFCHVFHRMLSWLQTDSHLLCTVLMRWHLGFGSRNTGWTFPVQWGCVESATPHPTNSHWNLLPSFHSFSNRPIPIDCFFTFVCIKCLTFNVSNSGR